jgi:lipoate-protein ligase A
MKWSLIKSGASPGKENMEFDMNLVRQCKEGQGFFRLYYWKPFAISLGAHQNENEINFKQASSDNIDVVKRPTGGRAILHAEELTYSVVMPLSFGLKPREIYEKISLALISGLSEYDTALSGAKLESEQPDFGSLLKKQSGMLCFASTARNEVKFNGKKLIGSAQRKLTDKVLQHGSVLIGKFHTNLPKYLNIDENSKTELFHELEKRTTEVETILNRKVDYAKFEDAIIAGFEKEWEIKF